jgi:hypothetical protein
MSYSRAQGPHTMVSTQGFNPDTGEWNDSLTGDRVRVDGAAGVVECVAAA